MQRNEMLSGRSVLKSCRFWFSKPLVMVVGLGLSAALVGLLVMVQSGWRVKAAVAAQAERVADGVWKATGEMARKRQVGGKLPAQALVWRLEEGALQRSR